MLPLRVLAGITAANGLTIYPSMENEVPGQRCPLAGLATIQDLVGLLLGSQMENLVYT
jgi:hypothetical protein